MPYVFIRGVLFILLKIGATLALFRSSGKIPLIKDLLKIIERDSEIIPATPLITLHGILSKPDAFSRGYPLWQPQPDHH